MIQLTALRMALWIALAALLGAIAAGGYAWIGDRARAPVEAEIAALRASIAAQTQIATDRAEAARHDADRRHESMLAAMAVEAARADAVLGDLADSRDDFDRRLRDTVASAVGRIRRASVSDAAAPASAGTDAASGMAIAAAGRLDAVSRRLTAIVDRAAAESVRLAECQAAYAGAVRATERMAPTVEPTR